MKKTICFLLLLLPLFGIAQTVILSGQVVDGKTKVPIEDAIVRIYMGGVIGEYKTTTDAQGNYALTAPEKPVDKDYPIIVQKEQYQIIRGVIKLNFGEEPLRNYRLYPIAQKQVVVKEVPKETPKTTSSIQDGPSLLGAPTNNLTFLIDISGSMEEENRLKNLKASILYLNQYLRPQDKVSIITYSSYSKILLNNGSSKDVDAIVKKLRASGKTSGYGGLRKAYDLALTNFENNGNNKIILATDGLFAEDKRSQSEVEDLISKGKGQDVVLSILSFDDNSKIVEKLTKWASLGEGNFTLVTNVEDAKKQLIDEAKGK